MSESDLIQGECAPQFERVREVFSESFERGDEVGASVCITLEGETVVDLWGGHLDKEKTQPWQRDTLANVYSTTKGITSLAAHRLIEEGRLELDAPVAKYWPEFAAAGKSELPVRYLLSHQAGLVAVAKPLHAGAMEEWDTMTAALAEQTPWWVPGEKHGYHALTFGWLVGELIRRVSGRSVGNYVREEIAEPLGVEFYIGCPEELDPRISELHAGPIIAPENGPSFDMVSEILSNPDGMFAKAFANPLPTGPLEAMASRRAWRAAEIPAANGHTNAHSLARIYTALSLGGTLDGVTLLSPESIERARTEQVCGEDEILPMRISRFGLGFYMPAEDEPVGPNSEVFGHAGAGGSHGQADPENRMGFGYVMNNLHQGVWMVDPRPRALLAAAYKAIE